MDYVRAVMLSRVATMLLGAVASVGLLEFFTAHFLVHDVCRTGA